MSKSKSKFKFKDNYELYSEIRRVWSFNPVERIVPNKKIYNRAKSKKQINND